MIGCGNMGGALLSRWLVADAVPRAGVRVCVADETAAEQVRRHHGVACGTDLAAAVAEADVVVVAVKPQQRTQVLQAALAARPEPPGPLWISILAAVRVEQLQQALGDQARISRWMPNTPVAVGRGVVAWSGSAALTQADLLRQDRLLAPLGLTLALPEAQIDAFTAVAGCGPAYVFALCEALQLAGQNAGLEPTQAAALARQTIIGAAWQLDGDPRPAHQLREAVTSKGGMTESALRQLQASGWSEAMTAAVRAAVQRAAELTVDS